MENSIVAKDFFSTGIATRFEAAMESVTLEESREFAIQDTCVRKDHLDGKPNTSYKSTAEGSIAAARAFLVGNAPSREEHLFFNKFRELYQLYRILRKK